jgi:hypothetical protein
MNPTGSQTYAGGSAVSVSAVAASGYQFSSWVSTGSISFESTTSSSTTAQINSEGSITANFAAITTGQNYQVTFALGTGGASMNPSGTQSYAAGSTVPITATATSGYRFSSWTSSGTLSFDGATSASTNAHIGSDGIITATFVSSQHTINVIQGANGVIAPGTTIVNEGATQIFSITPSSGYHVLDVVVDGSSKGAVSSWTFTNVQVDHTITASFASGTYHTITASAGSNGLISPSGSVSVLDGSSQTFTITPNAGYVIASLLVDGVSSGYGQSYTFTAVTMDHTIAATFVQGSGLINTGFDGNPWDNNWMAGGNPPWREGRNEGILGTDAAKSDSLTGDSGPFTSNAMNTQGASTIRVTFMYKVQNTNNPTDLKLEYCARNTATLPNLNPGSTDFTTIANIGQTTPSNTWMVGSITITNANAFAPYFYFRFESSLQTHGGLVETVWIDNIVITKS